jgi:hypothetical protein
MRGSRDGFGVVQGEHHEASASSFSASGSGRRRATGFAAHREGTSLPGEAGTIHNRICFGRLSLSDRLGHPFIVESRPGAGTNIATEAAVRSPSDADEAPFHEHGAEQATHWDVARAGHRLGHIGDGPVALLHAADVNEVGIEIDVLPQ